MTTVVQIEEAVDKREERRRVSTMSNMAAAFHALIIEVNRCKTLGDSDRATAFRAMRTRLKHLDQQAESLEEDSLDLVTAAMAKAEEA